LARGQRGHYFGRPMPQPAVADLHDYAFAGAQRIGCIHNGHTVTPRHLPVGARQKLAADPLPRKAWPFYCSGKNRDDAARPVRCFTDRDGLAERGVGLVDEFE